MNAPATPPRSSPQIEEAINRRLVNLRQEHADGQAQLRALEQRTRELTDTLTRISGAIAILEEMLEEERRAM